MGLVMPWVAAPLALCLWLALPLAVPFSIYRSMDLFNTCGAHALIPIPTPLQKSMFLMEDASLIGLATLQLVGYILTKHLIFDIMVTHTHIYIY